MKNLVKRITFLEKSIKSIKAYANNGMAHPYLNNLDGMEYELSELYRKYDEWETDEFGSW